MALPCPAAPFHAWASSRLKSPCFFAEMEGPPRRRTRGPSLAPHPKIICILSKAEGPSAYFYVGAVSRFSFGYNSTSHWNNSFKFPNERGSLPSQEQSSLNFYQSIRGYFYQTYRCNFQLQVRKLKSWNAVNDYCGRVHSQNLNFKSKDSNQLTQR